MSGFIIEIELPNDCFAVLETNTIRYWGSTGAFEMFSGTLDDFAAQFPEEFQSLLNLKVIKKARNA